MDNMGFNQLCNIIHANPAYINKRNIFSIKGEIKKKGINFPCLVKAYYRDSGRLIKQVQSDENGFFEITGLYQEPIFILALDPENQYNAVIQDNVVPK